MTPGWATAARPRAAGAPATEARLGGKKEARARLAAVAVLAAETALTLRRCHRPRSTCSQTSRPGVAHRRSESADPAGGRRPRHVPAMVLRAPTVGLVAAERFLPTTSKTTRRRPGVLAAGARFARRPTRGRTLRYRRLSARRSATRTPPYWSHPRRSRRRRCCRRRPGAAGISTGRALLLLTNPVPSPPPAGIRPPCRECRLSSCSWKPR